MRMNTWIAAALLTLGMSSCPAWAQTGDEAATASAGIAPAYANDLRAIMDATMLFENLSTPGPGPAQGSAAEREFAAAFMRQMTRDAVYRHMQPVYAGVLSAKRAAELAQLMKSPVFRKREARAISAPGNVSYGSSYFTSAEAAELRRIDSAPAMKELRAANPKLLGEIRKVTQAWSGEYGDRMARRAVDVLRKVQADIAANEPGKAQTITIGRVGLQYMDKIVWLVGSSMIRISNASRQFDKELEHLGFFDVLKPEYLASKVTLAHSRNVVDSAEAALDSLLKEVDSSMKEREDGMRAVEFTNKGSYVGMIDRSLGQTYGFFVDFGEANRKVLNQYRRTLSFFEERQGKLKLKDGQLLFESDADLAMAREILGNVDVAAAELRSIVAEQDKREEAHMNKYSGTPAPAGAN